MFKQIAKLGGNLLRGGLHALADKLDEVVDVVNSTQQASGDNFILVDHAQGVGQTFRLNIAEVIARVPKQYFIVPRVKVGANLFAGFYDGTIENGPFDSEDSDNLDLPQGLTDGASVLLVVTEEDQNNTDSLGNAPADAQRLLEGSYVVGPIIGNSTESTPRPLVWVRGGVGTMDDPTVLTPGDYGAASTSTWGWALDGTPVTKTSITSFGFDSSSGNIWFNIVTETYDARGMLRNVSAETQMTISTVACS